MLALFPIALVLSAGAVVTQNRPVEAFHAVQLEGGVRATLHRGKPQLKLEAEAAVLTRIESVVKDGTLIIRPKDRGVFDGDVKVTAEIWSEALDAAHASGGVVLQGEGLAGAKCELGLSGGAQVDLRGMACEALTIDASGGAGITLKGNAKRLSLDASGGVQLELKAMEVRDAKISASGGVSGTVAVADVIDADLSGGVSLKVKGHPKQARAETSGAAKLSYE